MSNPNYGTPEQNAEVQKWCDDAAERLAKGESMFASAPSPAAKHELPGEARAERAAREIYYAAIRMSECASTEDHARRIERFAKTIVRYSQSDLRVRETPSTQTLLNP